MKKVLETIEEAILKTIETEEGTMIEVECKGELVYVIVGLAQNFDIDAETELDEELPYH